MLGWKQMLMVGMGGALGSIARYKLGGFVLHRTEAWDFPFSTLSVDLLGCLIIGLCAALAEHHDLFAPATRLFLFTGLLGGFTTFSAFGYESVFLLRRGLLNMSILYVGLSTLGGLAAVWAGMQCVVLIWPTRH